MTAEHGEDLPADAQELARRALRRLIGRGGGLYRLVPISADDASRTITDPTAADEYIAALPADAASNGGGYLLATEALGRADGAKSGNDAGSTPGILPGDGRPPGAADDADHLDADVQQLLARIETTGSRLSLKGL